MAVRKTNPPPGFKTAPQKQGDRIINWKVTEKDIRPAVITGFFNDGNLVHLMCALSKKDYVVPKENILPFKAPAHKINPFDPDVHKAEIREAEAKSKPSTAEATPPSQEKIMCKYGELYLSPGNVLTFFFPDYGTPGSCAGHQFIGVGLSKDDRFVRYIHRTDPGHNECHAGIDRSRDENHAHLKLHPKLSHASIKDLISTTEDAVTASPNAIKEDPYMLFLQRFIQAANRLEQ